MVLIFYKTAKHLSFMRFSSVQKRLNLAAFGTDPLNSQPKNPHHPPFYKSNHQRYYIQNDKLHKQHYY